MEIQRNRRRDRARMRAGALVVDSLFRGLSAAGRAHPRSRPDRHGVEVLRDLPYRETGLPEHRLDIWRPAGAEGPLPVVLYVHGGGFRILSKDTHWLMGLRIARRGFVVVNVSYRLAPRHAFPAAIEDVCAALAWTIDHIAAYGGDPSRIAFAGESAGGNLVTSLALCCSYERPEPFARAIFDREVRPVGVAALYGLLQVSDPERFWRERDLPWWLRDRIREVSEAYLPDPPPDHGLDLADPVLVLERGERPARPLPPFLAPCGTRDPLLDDSRRLAAALEALGTPCTATTYPGEVHAFHVLLWRENARRCWDELHGFLDTACGC